MCFFVDDKAMPIWSIVLKKEARGRRICLDETDNALGQEESSGDMDTYSDMGRGGSSEDNVVILGNDMTTTVNNRRWTFC